MAHDRRYAYGYGPNGQAKLEARWQEEARRMAEEAEARQELAKEENDDAN